MHWYANWDTGWMWGMHLVWWVFWIVLAAIIWWLLDRSAGARGDPPRESPLETLRRRYAEGALTTEEYEQRRRKLMDSAASS